MTRSSASAPNVKILPVIETKLAPAPPSTPWLDRPRLVEALSSQDSPRAVLLCAPAGYGKTVLMSQSYGRLTERGVKVGWASFDKYDATPVHFLLYVMAALRQACPGFGSQFFRLLGEHGDADVNFYLDVALTELAALDESVWIFLDDLDNAATPTLPDMLEAIIRYSSNSIHYVLSARDRHQLSFWQLRAESRLHLMDTQALAFNASEARGYFDSCGLSGLSEAQIDSLAQATEGWCMGLQLARLALGLDGASQTIMQALSGRNRNVSGYLLHHVLDAQPSEVRTFLLKTSILGRLCAENCDAVVGAGNSHAMLSKLEQTNLFLIGLDSDGKWFRYHHLFQEFLQQQLGAIFGSEVAHLRRTASSWFRQQNLAEEALELARATGDVEFIAETLDATCTTLAYTGNHSVFRAAVDSTEERVLVKYPRLALDHVWVELMNWNFRAAEHLLQQIDAIHGAGNTHTETADGLGEKLLHQRLMVAFFGGDVVKAAQLCEQWLESYPRGDHYVAGSVYIVLLMSRSYMLDNTGVAAAAKQAESFYRNERRRNGLVWHNCIIGLTHEACGSLGPALQAYTDALALSKGLVGAPLGVLAMPAVFTAHIFYEQNELDKAQWLIDAHPATDSPGGLIDYVVAYTLTRAKLHTAYNRPNEALGALDEGIDFAAAHNLPHVARLFQGERTRQELALGRLTEARDRATRAGIFPNEPAAPEAGKTVWDADTAITWARVMIAGGQHKQAQGLLRRWMDYCSTRNSNRLAVVFALLLTRSKILEGDAGAALRVLGPAVKKGEELGMVRTFVDEGSVIRALLVKLYESDGALSADQKVYVRKLLCAYARDPMPVSVDCSSQSVTALSSRELEILKLISQGIKSSFVGSRLGITEGTVKWHMQHVFHKLGVRNRREAIERARTLGMIEV